MSANPMRNIQRIRIAKYPGSLPNAWQVRFRRRYKDQSKIFADRVYGGEAESLVAAKRYRDETEKRVLYLDKISFSNVERINNQSGVTGVRYCEVKGRNKDGSETVSYYWQAFWNFGGKNCNKFFSIRRYGFEGARERAIQTRKEAEAAYNAAHGNKSIPWNQVPVQPVISLEEVPEPVIPPVEHPEVPRRTNKTGVAGVYCDQKSERYFSSWRIDGRRVATSFSISKYGKEGAFNKAVAARRQRTTTPVMD